MDVTKVMVLGVRVVEALQQHYHLPDGVDLPNGGTCGMAQIDDMMSCQHLIVADAVLTGAESGTSVTLREGDVPESDNASA